MLEIRESSAYTDSGYYECRAMNVVAREPSTSRIRLIVALPTTASSSWSHDSNESVNSKNHKQMKGVSNGEKSIWAASSTSSFLLTSSEEMDGADHSHSSQANSQQKIAKNTSDLLFRPRNSTSSSYSFFNDTHVVNITNKRSYWSGVSSTSSTSSSTVSGVFNSKTPAQSTTSTSTTTSSPVSDKKSIKSPDPSSTISVGIINDRGEGGEEVGASREATTSPFRGRSCPIQLSRSFCLNGGTCLYYETVGELVCQ